MMRPVGSPEELERKRQRAITLIEQGITQAEIARVLGVEPRSVRRWKHAWTEGGREALGATRATGRPPRLSARDRQKLEKQLLKGAVSAGFPTDLWTCPRVADYIERTFGVQYHVDHVCRLLHGMHWSPQKPVRKAVERDEEAIQQWVKQDWPALKKKRTG
ncbi:IS630 family transposase [Terriglobus albidus]|nr:IS630 family transposase [Terriglobus albidus]QEE30812.1 IS630 family transposase [Terriglobus albidus]